MARAMSLVACVPPTSTTTGVNLPLSSSLMPFQTSRVCLVSGISTKTVG